MIPDPYPGGQIIMVQIRIRIHNTGKKSVKNGYFYFPAPKSLQPQREHPAHHNIKFLKFFSISRANIELLDPDSLISLNPDPIRNRICYTWSKYGLPGSSDEEETTVTGPPDPEELLQNRQPEQQNSQGIVKNVMRLPLKRNRKSK
jgi:hypothetical protein